MQIEHSHDYYREQINSLTRIPSLPLIATELMEATNDDKLSVNQLLPIIEKDPPLAMKVLKIANSAYYGMYRRVESLRHALVIIGMKELGDLSIGFSVMNTLSDPGDPAGLQWNKLWEHSAGVGHIAQMLQENLGIQTGSSPYALGLLHDVGKIILYRLEPEKYVQIIDFALKNGTSSEEAENHFLGIDHMTVGGWIAEKWQLPVSIHDAIKFHHSPDRVNDPESSVSTALVQLADIVANLQSISFGKAFQRTIITEEPCWIILKDVSPKLVDLDFEHFVMSIEDEVMVIKDFIRLLRGQ